MSPNCKCISLICVALSMLTAGCSHTYRVGDYTLLEPNHQVIQFTENSPFFSKQIPCHL